MIIALFIFTILNYYTFAFDLPDWVQTVSLIAQIFCFIVAFAIWDGWKFEVEILKRRLEERDDENERKK